MVDLDPIFKRAYWTLASLGGVYAIFLLCITNHSLQRYALYAHKFHTGFWHDVDNPESFGFAKNQITPFNLTTPDGETLYCWHVLPLDVYAEHEREITAQPSGPVDDLTKTTGYKLLKADPKSRVVINFHGNAGHIAQGWRTTTYATLTTLPHTHLLTCSYRGFHRSTGTPSESGLLTDGIALTHHVLHTLSHPAPRTLILGQSLGTAVAAGVALHYTDPGSPALPTDLAPPPAARGKGGAGPQRFAGVILAAAFPSLPELLRTYRIAGVFPVLSPLRPYPYLTSLLEKRVVDTWNTGARMAALVQAGKKSGVGVRVSVLHARDDGDISWRLGEEVYKGMERAMVGDPGVAKTEERRSVLGAERVTRGAMVYRAVEDWPVGEEAVRGGRVVELEVIRYGGHNRIMTFAPVALAIARAFDSV